MFKPTDCMTCKSLRRFVVSLGLGGFLTWYMTSGLEAGDDEQTAILAFLWVVIAIVTVSVMVRVRQIRSRFRR